MQPVSIPDLWDQLGFLVTRILGGDSHFIFSTNKRQEFLVSLYFPDRHMMSEEDDRRDAAHMWQF
jgi:hypothetical protein